MRLYYSPNSCALASHIILEEIGADYSLELVDFTKNEQKKPDYLKVNPKARVPALQTKDGIITETPAILLFLAQCFPSQNVAPLDQSFRLAQAQEFNSYLCSTVHVAHAHLGRGSRWSDDEAAIVSMTKKVPENVGNCFQLIDEKMIKGPWVLGEHFSICDAYLYTLTRWLERDGVERQQLPKVNTHFLKMEERPSIQSIIHYHEK